MAQRKAGMKIRTVALMVFFTAIFALSFAIPAMPSFHEPEVRPFLYCKITEFAPSPDSGHPESRLAAGKFLVASRNVEDPRFRETVILLIKYDSEGAMGLIVNRSTDARLSEVFSEIKGLQKRNDTFFVGGPVGLNQVFVLIRSKHPPDESLLIPRDIYITSNIDSFKRIVENAEADERFRVYAGYAGWSPGQLEMEVSRGDWHIIKADAETIFDRDPSSIWQELIVRSSGTQVKLW